MRGGEEFSMSEPQSALIPEPGRSALFLVLRVTEAKVTTQVAKVLAGVPAMTGELIAQAPDANLVSAVGIGSEFWDRLSPRKRPIGLRAFAPVEADGRSAPATGGDLLVHLVSDRHDVNFDLALRLRRQLGGAVEVLEEVHGFRYLDSRDLTGFIDGTENPQGAERAAVALIGAEDPDFAGGSYAHTQKFLHDLDRWRRLETAEQERIIGRRKADSEDLPAAVKPATAHINRATIEENGTELKIVRHSFPFGTTSAAGLFFIAYCRTLDIPERMLRRLIGTSRDGVHDRLMEFTRAVTGANFFVPSLPVLGALVTPGSA